MKCAKCGAEMGGYLICPNCGAPCFKGREAFDDCVKIYSKIIKDDEYIVKQIYLHALSAYTPEPSNCQSIAGPSLGKTHGNVNVTRFFPEGDVLNLGGLSPTAIVHDAGRIVHRGDGRDLENELNELYIDLDKSEEKEKPAERKKAKREVNTKIHNLLKDSITEVNLENRILCFLDKPKPQTLEMLKPILSHDKFEILYKITDKSGKGRLATKNIKIKGWPAVLVASTRVAATDDMWAEIVSRFDTISPNVSPEKFRAAVKLTAMRKGLPNGALSVKLGLQDFEYVKVVTKAVKEELIRLRDANKTAGEFTPNIFWVPFYSRLGEGLPAEVGQHMRDSTRFFTALQMHAAANLFNRPRVIVEGKPSLIVIRRDYEAAKSLYFEGERGESLMTGVPERILRWFSDVFVSCWAEVDEPSKKGQLKLSGDGDSKEVFTPIWITSGQLTDKTRAVWTHPLTTDAIRTRYLNELIKAGYVDAQDHPIDKRAKHYRPLVDENTRKKTILNDEGMFSLESLREALEELQKITDWKQAISIQDYDGSPLTLEQLHAKYYSDFRGSLSVNLSLEVTAPNDETGENKAESDIIANNRLNSKKDEAEPSLTPVQNNPPNPSLTVTESCPFGCSLEAGQNIVNHIKAFHTGQPQPKPEDVHAPKGGGEKNGSMEPITQQSSETPQPDPESSKRARNQASLQCPRCPVKFSSEKALQAHVDYYHFMNLTEAMGKATAKVRDMGRGAEAPTEEELRSALVDMGWPPLFINRVYNGITQKNGTVWKGVDGRLHPR